MTPRVPGEEAEDTLATVSASITTTTTVTTPNSTTGRILSLTHFLPINCEWHKPSTDTPVDGAVDEGKWHFGRRRGHSAMYAGITSLSSSAHPHWHIGGLGRLQTNDGAMIRSSMLSDHQKTTLVNGLREQHSSVPVLLDEEASYGHYEGYCKGGKLIMALFHYLPPNSYNDSNLAQSNWQSYMNVNQAFTDALVQVYRPGDLIWIHDYHLLLVPSLIRKLIPNAAIGFFLHSPFPSSEIFRSLPRRKQILEGVLGANLIGFQTYSYARHFISSCTRVLGLESTPTGVDYHGTHVAISIFPIGVDVKLTEHYRRSAGVLEKIQRLRELYAGKRIIVTTPGQVGLPKLEKQIAEAVARINGRFGSIEFIPVHHYRQQIDRDEFLALLSIADVALITSIRDGMNTTSHEYVICQHNDGQNPLILSEFTGTAGSLSAAILVNPWDYVGVAEAIHEALTLSPEDKRTKHQHLALGTVIYSELQANLRIRGRGSTTPALNATTICNAFSSAKKRLLMFDYDGTLTAIRKTPNAAVPPPEMIEALTQLATDPQNMVWVEWINLLEKDDLSWKKEVSEIFDYYTERTQGSFIEHKSSSITWHYRLADPAFGEFQAKECQNHLENAVLSKLPVEILVGKKNLEVRPVSINKGGVVSRLIEAANNECDFVICAGDDKTDEDMFRAIQRNSYLEDPSRVFCITIGGAAKKTAADWHVPSPEQLITILRQLAELPAAKPGWYQHDGDDHEERIVRRQHLMLPMFNNNNNNQASKTIWILDNC
ncbi:hypothetical protein BDF19DRAFT_415337 [Syncephalis fuscata]|nr:hypothetical protein BDF19DRAFT_415337 [Syncephalis fuscata]